MTSMSQSRDKNLIDIKFFLPYLFKVRGNKSNSAILIFASFLRGSQLLKEKICSYKSNFFPIRSDSTFWRVSSASEATKCHELLPFVKKWQKKHGVVSIHLIVNISYLINNFLVCFRIF